MTTDKPSFEFLDRMFASHFGAAPLLSKREGSSPASSADHEEAKTQSHPGSVRSMKSGTAPTLDAERAQKVQELYSTLANLYVEEQRQHDPARDSQSSNGASINSRSPLSLFEELHGSESAPSPTSSLGFSAQQSTRPTGGWLADFDFKVTSRRNSHEEARKVLRESKSDVALPTLATRAPQDPLDTGVAPDAIEKSEEAEVPVEMAPLSFARGRSDTKSRLDRGLQLMLPIKEITVAAPVQDIEFSVVNVPDLHMDEHEARDLLAKTFPQLCEAPARMFGENGEPLPPTKKEETTAEERQARKEALSVQFCGKRTHSLIKSVVLLESRTATWKKVGAATSADAKTKALPAVPDPWKLEFQHQDLEKLRKETKAKRAFELTDSRVDAQCGTCHGKGLDACQTCKGEEADECWWCAGSGKNKDRRDCERCLGLGKLNCQACSGKLVSKCLPCSGEGSALYSIIVNIRVRTINFPPVATSLILPVGYDQDEESIRSVATLRTRELIERLITISNAKAKHPFRPLNAACSWETSTSSLIEVEAAQAAKMLTRKSSFGSGLRRQKSNGSLRPTGLNRKIAMATKYYILPSDPDLRTAEMSKEEFYEALFVDTAPATKHNEASLSDMVKARRVSHTSELSSAPSAVMLPMSGAFKPQDTALAQLSLSSSPAGTPHAEVEREGGNYFGGLLGGATSLLSRNPSRTRSHVRHHQRNVLPASPALGSQSLLGHHREKSASSTSSSFASHGAKSAEKSANAFFAAAI